MKEYITQTRAEELARLQCKRYIHIDTEASYSFDGHTLMDFVRDIQAAAIQAYIDSLPADLVLPEPFKKQGQQLSADGCDVCFCDLWEAGQVRQAIADALASPAHQWQPIETAPNQDAQ